VEWTPRERRFTSLPLANWGDGIDAMNGAADATDPPNLVALAVAHILIGLLVGGVMIAAAIAVMFHYNFDAPLAQRLSSLGNQVFNSRSVR
jgi:hypothetical protein